MLEYIKEILKKVSFDRVLFLKELNKSHRWLTREEMTSLMKWAGENQPDKPELTDKFHTAKYPPLNK